MHPTTTLTLWRRELAGLDLASLAHKAGMTQQCAARFEENPSSATLAELRSYALACGGRLRVHLEVNGQTRELVL